MQRAPEDPAPRVALADLLLASYNNAEALPLFQEAMQLDAEHPDALLGLARSLRFDSSGGALELAQTAVQLAPGRVDARVLLADLLVEQEDPDGAEAQLAAALDVNPRSPHALSVLAALRDAAGDDDAVSALMARVLALAPGFAEGYVILAEAATDRRRYADAVRYAVRAVSLDARAWRAHALLGMNRLRLGELKSARLSLEKAFRGDPFNVWVKNTLDLLDGMDEYARVTSERFLFTARPDHAEVLAPLVLDIAEQAFDALEARYGAPTRKPLRIEVHPEHDDLSVRTLGLVGVDLLGVSFGPTVVLDRPMASPGGPSNWASTLWHELAHSFQFVVSEGRAPRWLAEGMAVHGEWTAFEGWGSDPGPGFLQAYLEGKLARASELNASFLRPDSGEALGHAYVQAGLLVEMLERRRCSRSSPGTATVPAPRGCCAACSGSRPRSWTRTSTRTCSSASAARWRRSRAAASSRRATRSCCAAAARRWRPVTSTRPRRRCSRRAGWCPGTWVTAARTARWWTCTASAATVPRPRRRWPSGWPWTRTRWTRSASWPTRARRWASAMPRSARSSVRC